MRRGTTPTHTFQLPVDAATLEEVKIIYAQSGKVILTKHKEDCTIDGTSVSVRLTQAETFKFKDTAPYKVQVRALTADDDSLVSNIIVEDVEPILDEDVVLE